MDFCLSLLNPLSSSPWYLESGINAWISLLDIKPRVEKRKAIISQQSAERMNPLGPGAPGTASHRVSFFSASPTGLWAP